MTKKPKPPQETERAFQNRVVKLAKLSGWRVYHTYDSRRSEPGFPDLVMVHNQRGLVFAELKREKGRLTPAQKTWIGELGVVSAQTFGFSVFVWRPSDWDDIVFVLTGR